MAARFEIWNTGSREKSQVITEQTAGSRVHPDLDAKILEAFVGDTNDPIQVLKYCNWNQGGLPNAHLGVAKATFAQHKVLNKVDGFEYAEIPGRKIALRMSILPLTVMGVTLSRDGYALVSIRKPGEGVSIGAHTIVPGGYVDGEDKGPFEAVSREFGQEAAPLIKYTKGKMQGGIHHLTDCYATGLVYSDGVNRGISVPFVIYVNTTGEEMLAQMNASKSTEMKTHDIVKYDLDHLTGFLTDITEEDPNLMSNHGLAALLLGLREVEGEGAYEVFLRTIRDNYGDVLEFAPTTSIVNVRERIQNTQSRI